MKYQDFEKGLKGKLQNATEHVDVDALILNIHAVKPRKNRKIIFWLFLFTSTLALGFSGLHYIENQKTSLNKVPLQNLASDTQNSKIDNTKKSDSSIPVDQSMAETQKNNLQSKNISSLYVAEKSNQEKVKPIFKNEKNTASKPREEKISTHQAVDVMNADQETPLYAPRSPAPSISKSDITSKTRLSTLTTLPLLNAPLESRGLIYSDPIVCPTFKKPRWALDLIPEIGIILPFKNLSNNSVETNPVFAMRSAEERTLEGLQAALYLRIRPVQKPIYLKFGVSYTRISEQMKLNTTWIERDTSVGIISITQSQSGDTITTIYGDIVTETENFRKSSDHYYLHLVDLPISLGYNKSLGNGWRLGAEAGVQVNLSFRSSGKLLEGSGENSFTNLPADGRFRARLGLSYFGGITLEKTLSPRTAFYITPRMRLFNSTFTPDSYDIRQQYTFAGLHAGFVYTIR